MPLFFFVSGWLLNLDKLRMLSTKHFIEKYGKRMLLWWFFAWLVYDGSFLIIHLHELNLELIIKHILSPYYHLWFVPGLFVTISFVWFLLRFFSMANTHVVALTICVGFLFLMLINTEHLPDNTIIRKYNFLFLSIGIFCKQLNINRLNTYRGGVIFMIFLFSIILTFLLEIKETSAYNVLYLICLATAFSPIIKNDSLSHNFFLEWLGRNSLQIYLWHVIPIVFLKYFFANCEVIYYSVSSILFISFFFIAYTFTEKRY